MASKPRKRLRNRWFRRLRLSLHCRLLKKNSNRKNKRRVSKFDMAVKIKIPTPLRKVTGGQGEVEVSGKSVIEVIELLDKDFPGIKERICDESGELRRFVNIYVNQEDIRFIKGKDTPLKDGDRSEEHT